MNLEAAPYWIPAFAGNDELRTPDRPYAAACSRGW